MRGIAKGKGLAVVFIMLGSLLAGMSLLPSAQAAVLYVGGAGPGNYTTIQAAIDAASPGDTIFMFNGTYQENVLVDKALSLIGEDNTATTIDGGGVGDAVNITANWVNVTGFEVVNQGQISSTGIRLHSVGDCLIANNSIHSTEEGVILHYSTDNRIVGNTFSSNWGAIYLVSSDDNEILDNRISSIWDGIHLSLSDHNTLTGNSAKNGWDGIVMDTSHFNTVISNNASNNARYGIYLVGATNNTVYHDNLVGNGNSPAREDYGHDNVRDNGYPSGGNYYGPCTDVMWGWNQDHPGSDGIRDYPANDGICDYPVGWGFDYSDPNNVIWLTDKYPLAYPFGSSFTLPDLPRKWHIYDFGQMQGYAMSPSLALNKSGHPHISFPQDSQLKHSHWSNGTWTVQTVDSNASWQPSNAIDSNDRPHISYLSEEGLKYARWNGTHWETEVVDSAGQGDTSIAIGPDDRPHIDYYVEGPILAHANWTGSSWNVETVAISQDDWSADIAVNSSGHPHMSYAGAGWTLRHAYWTGSGWNDEEVDGGGYYTSIALDENDHPHISYIYAGDWVLKYAKWTGSSWNTETVDTYCYVMEGSSIALDSVDYPHIAYRNYCGDIRHAKWTGSLWKNETVDFWGDFPFKTSLALDQDDKPHIAYRDYSSRAIYAARTDRIFFYEPAYPPRNLKANPGDKQVTLTWKEPQVDWGLEITNYTIYRGTSPGGEVFLADIGNVLNYTDTNVTNGQTYCYQVSAWNEVGESARSSEVCAIPSLLPGPPTNLTAEPQYGDIALSWSDPLDDGGSPVTNYRIFRSTIPGGETFLAEIGNELAYLDTGVTTGITYYYQVSAVNGAGEGAKSVEVSATAADAPSAPMNLTAKADIHKVVLTWEEPAYDGGMPIINYTIYRGTNTNPEIVLAEIGNVLTYTDTEAKVGRTYYYRVSAKNAAGEGPKSNEVSVTVPTMWKPPLDLISIPGIENITVNWTPPGGGGGGIRICGSTVYEDCVWEAGTVPSGQSSSRRAGG